LYFKYQKFFFLVIFLRGALYPLHPRERFACTPFRGVFTFLPLGGKYAGPFLLLHPPPFLFCNEITLWKDLVPFLSFPFLFFSFLQSDNQKKEEGYPIARKEKKRKEKRIR
jgi:hypothetical protein